MSANRKITIEYSGVEIIVVGEYTPEEQEVRYYSDGSGYPGAPAEFEIQKILYKGVDVFDIYENLDELEDIAEACIDKIDYGED